MKRFALCCLVLAASAFGFAQASSWWRIPGVGSGPGAYGSQWASDIYLYNPNADAIEVKVILFYATGGYGPHTYPVPAGGSATIEDVGAPFALQGAGAIQLYTEDQAKFYVMSRTYNTAEVNGVLETTGQDVPGQDWCAGQDPGGASKGLLFLGLQQNARFRTNLGFMASDALDLKVEVHDGGGALVTSIPVHLGGTTALQINLSAYTGAAVTNGYAIAFLDGTVSGCFNGYASVADNQTNDATTIMGQPIQRP